MFEPGVPSDMWLQFLKCRGNEHRGEAGGDGQCGVCGEGALVSGGNMRVHLAVWGIAGST